MHKNLLYLYNDGHNPFPHLGKGGLGYKLPQYRKRIHGEALHRTVNDEGDVLDEYDDDNMEDPHTYDTLFNEGFDEDEDEGIYYPNAVGRVEYDQSGDIIRKGFYNDENRLIFDEYLNDDEKEKLRNPKKGLTISDLNEDEQQSIRDEIEEYVKQWKKSTTIEKRILTQKFNNKIDLTEDQKKIITKLKNSNNIDGLNEYLITQKFVIKEEEVIEGFEPDNTPQIKLPQEDIDIIKTSDIISDDVLPYIKYNNILQSYNDCKENPFKSLLGDDYTNIGKTTDENIVNSLLYDDSGKYASGKDFEDKVLKNMDLVKNILIATYGKDVDLETVKINYEAEAGKGDLFTVFDAHAVSFKINGKNKEAFIEFKKYANYTPSISDLNVLLQSEENDFNNFIYQKIYEIKIISEKIDNAILEKNKKEINKLKIELNNYLSENDINDKDKMMKEFYKELNPVGIGVKYTKFPPLPHDLKRPEKSVNSEEGYKYIMGYETNKKRRKKANVATHLKANDEEIDILICTGLINSMVVCNISDLLKKYPDKNHIDYLKLKKTVYGTTQKGTKGTKKRIDYDHFNIPISYFKNVSLITNSPIQQKKSKSKSKSQHLEV